VAIHRRIVPPEGSAVRWGGEAEEFVAWCLRTRDRIAYAAALGSVPEQTSPNGLRPTAIECVTDCPVP